MLTLISSAGIILANSQSSPQIQQCVPNTQNLPNVTDSRFTPCFLLNTNIQNTQRYYDTENDVTIANIDLKSVETVEQLCTQFCDKTQLPTTCLDDSYNKCLNRFPIGNCGLEPAAKQNLNIFYPIGRGKISC